MLRPHEWARDEGVVQRHAKQCETWPFFLRSYHSAFQRAAGFAHRMVSRLLFPVRLEILTQVHKPPTDS